MSIKVILFDVDGTLVSSKNIHYEALNQALGEISPEHIISRHDHETVFDGLPTKRKLELLTERGLSSDLHPRINERKQFLTASVIKSYNFNIDHAATMKHLKDMKFLLGVCSNAIPDTVYAILDNLQIAQYFDLILCNDSVKHGKPYPDIYIKAMEYFGVKPEEVLILEDSPHGIESVRSSGAHLMKIDNPLDVTVYSIMNVLYYLDMKDLVQ